MKWWMRLRRSAAVEATLPRHIEIWGHIVENNRFLRRAVGFTLALTFAALAVAAYGVLAGLTPRAYHVDASGQAIYVGRLREQLAPSPAEVRYVAKEFFKRYIAMNSQTVQSDLADAWNLMTEELRAEQRRVLDGFEKTQGTEFVAYVKKQGIQTEFEFDAKRIDVVDHNQKTYTVHLRGAARTWPLGRAGEDAAFTEKEFDAFVTLVRCPRTEQTPNGLLVSKITRRFYAREPAAAEASPAKREE
jgi:hypothetical protein